MFLLSFDWLRGNLITCKGCSSPIICLGDVSPRYYILLYVGPMLSFAVL